MHRVGLSTDGSGETIESSLPSGQLDDTFSGLIFLLFFFLPPLSLSLRSGEMPSLKKNTSDTHFDMEHEGFLDIYMALEMESID